VARRFRAGPGQAGPGQAGPPAASAPGWTATAAPRLVSVRACVRAEMRRVLRAARGLRHAAR